MYFTLYFTLIAHRTNILVRFPFSYQVTLNLESSIPPERSLTYSDGSFAHALAFRRNQKFQLTFRHTLAYLRQVVRCSNIFLQGTGPMIGNVSFINLVNLVARVLIFTGLVFEPVCNQSGPMYCQLLIFIACLVFTSIDFIGNCFCDTYRSVSGVPF